MMRSSSIVAVRRSALAVGMCLLAFLFAVEAKLAWYSPSTTPLSAIQSAKARPADAPDPIAQILSAVISSPQQFSLLLFVAFSAACLVKASPSLAIGVNPRTRRDSMAVFLSPTLFFRPPPSC